MLSALALLGLAIVWVWQATFLVRVRFDAPPPHWTKGAQIMYLLSIFFMLMTQIAAVVALGYVVLRAVFAKP